MSEITFANLNELATHLRKELEEKKYILLYAYNGTGKTRLSTTFKDLGKVVNADGEVTQRDTLYFNAFTEDLFSWDNDLENDLKRVLTLNGDSQFFAGLREMEMDVKIGKQLERYADFNFYIDYEEWTVTFFREREVNGDPIPIKVSRGEENIFIWCFFLTIVQLAMDNAEAYRWVKYIYIDDPVSSLDEHNAIAVGNHLAQILKKQNGQLKTVISTHHPLFFNVLFNELGNAKKYFLSLNKIPQPGGYLLRAQKKDTPFFYHISLLTDLYQADKTGRLYTYHFSMLRSLLEKSASFHGFPNFSACIKQDGDDPDGILHARLINILSHGDYSLYEPKEMLEENKVYFKKILNEFVNRYPFNPEIFAEVAEEAKT